MEELRRVVPFECRRCWHVWEEEYLVRHGEDRHGNERVVWMQGGVAVPPPTEGMICPRCHCQQATTFPEGYLRHHPELIPPQEPARPDDTPLLSPVPKRPRY